MTTDPLTLHPTPNWRNVIAAQLWVVWLAVRKPVALTAAVVATVTTYLVVTAFRVGEGIPVDHEPSYLVALLAFLVPIAVWKGELFQRSHFARLPVGRTPHMLVKVAAGWVWLMILVAAFLLWLVGLALVTGGGVGVDQRVMVHDLPAGIVPADGASLARRWEMPGWQWGSYATGATVTYLLGSAVVLAGSRTRRWLACVALGCVLLVVAGNEGGRVRGLARAPAIAAETLVHGRYGLRTVVSGQTGPVRVVTDTRARAVTVWDTPTAGLWLSATLMWTLAATASVAASSLGSRRRR